MKSSSSGWITFVNKKLYY